MDAMACIKIIFSYCVSLRKPVTSSTSPLHSIPCVVDNSVTVLYALCCSMNAILYLIAA